MKLGGKGVSRLTTFCALLFLIILLISVIPIGILSSTMIDSDYTRINMVEQFIKRLNSPLLVILAYTLVILPMVVIATVMVLKGTKRYNNYTKLILSGKELDAQKELVRDNREKIINTLLLMIYAFILSFKDKFIGLILIIFFAIVWLIPCWILYEKLLKQSMKLAKQLGKVNKQDCNNNTTEENEEIFRGYDSLDIYFQDEEDEMADNKNGD